jgi:hypothetical protein
MKAMQFSFKTYKTKNVSEEREYDHEGYEVCKDSFYETVALAT